MDHAKRWLLCGMLVMAGCVGGAWAQTVPIYDATQISLDRYQVIERLWVGSWRTAWSIPHAATRDAAVAGLVRAAARAHADGLVNVYCLAETDRGGTPGDYYCYGNAIRLKGAPAR